MSNPFRWFAWDPKRGAWQDGAAGTAPAAPARLNLVLPYTDWTLADATLSRLEQTLPRLDAVVELVAVQPTPYPAPMGSAIPAYIFLVEQLAGLAQRHVIDLRLKVVLARYWNEGLRSALQPESLVVIGAWERFWPTREVRLARTLAREGRDVTLWRMDRRSLRRPDRAASSTSLDRHRQHLPV